MREQRSQFESAARIYKNNGINLELQIGEYREQLGQVNAFTHIIYNLADNLSVSAALKHQKGATDLVERTRQTVLDYVALLRDFPVFRERQFEEGFEAYAHDVPIEEYVDKMIVELRGP